MSLQEKLKPFIKYVKIAAVITSSGFYFSYQIGKTIKTIGKIVSTNVLEQEKKTNPEYIYIDDPAYSVIVKNENDKQNQIVFARIWKSLKHSLAWRLLWLCRHGNRVHRNFALERLSAFRNSKDWDCLTIAQALDKDTAVLLARTKGADLRYFLPPPLHVRRAATTPELMSFKLKDLIVAAQGVHPHSCIQHFLSKYFANVQEQAMDSDHIPTKPDSISERDLCMLCLDAIHHHLNLFYEDEYEDDITVKTLISSGLLSRIAELFMRNKNDPDLDLAILRILTVLSVHCNLLDEFFQNGLIGQLSRLIRSSDVRLSSSAAVCLANLSGEYCYRPGLYLLHPIYRTSEPPACDTLLVHGLRGGVFVTWRQRDRNCLQPLGLVDVTVSDVDCEPCDESTTQLDISDPDFRQVMEDLMEIEDETMLADLEVVLHDIPLNAKREPKNSTYTAIHKRMALHKEEQDHCRYTFCWPKDWLPKDVANLRILGVNYWSSLSEWLERCPLQSADIASRASELAPTLVAAGVGRGDRPVVWLAHSMGGLIAKQMLVDISESDDSLLKKLCENTRALLFYSTPHKGSSLATMPRAAAAILWPSNDVRQLQENSPELLQLHDAFNRVADLYNWETISFAETKPTLVTAFKVPVSFVQSFSADLGRGVFYELPLDHLSICKPATRQSILYTTVLDVLNRATRHDSSLRFHSTNVTWLIDFIWRNLSEKAKEVFDTIDESQNPERLKWFERILLETFIDGFMD